MSTGSTVTNLDDDDDDDISGNWVSLSLTLSKLFHHHLPCKIFHNVLVNILHFWLPETYHTPLKWLAILMVIQFEINFCVFLLHLYSLFSRGTYNCT